MKHVNKKILNDNCANNQSFVNDMIETFISSSTKDIEEINTALEQQDKRALKFKFHKLRSSLLFIGVTKLSDLAEEIEENVHNIPHSELLEKVNEFKGIHQEVIRELNDLYLIHS